MVPEIFANYFLASAGAGAALIGLLFVAISLRPEKTLGDEAHPVRSGVATGAFIALTNAFFVSMSALIPLANVGDFVVAIGVADVVMTLFLARKIVLGILRPLGVTLPALASTRILATLVISASLYAYEAFIGLGMAQHARNPGYAFALSEILLGVYAIGLLRAWELLGGSGGFVARLLNPLRDAGAAEDARSPEK
ncbi:MAG TPA: hypothetical protein VFN78_06145 [Ktedonobacterales bacterium]|nr:hypothetical protein [Ktedonobacterales bacterium]